MSSKKINLAIVGSGFGSTFYFHLHPNVNVVAVVAKLPLESKKLSKIYSCNRAHPSLEEILTDQSIDAIALFTPAQLHAEQSIQCLNNGKHVLCAVPVGLSMEECVQVKKAVKQSGLIYMMAETSYFRQDVISARNFYKENEFGNILSVKAQYLHPGLSDYFFDESGNPTWRHGLPPMLYATHCTTYLTGVTEEKIKSVSCLGWTDHDSLINNNKFNNKYWNQTALFASENNIPFEVNISWKGAFISTERGEWYGDNMSFITEEPITQKSYLLKNTSEIAFDDGGFPNHSAKVEIYKPKNWWNSDLLPQELRIPSEHNGSHTFLTHEFIEAILHQRTPKINIELAINLTIPGITANESAKLNGETLKVLSYDNL